MWVFVMILFIIFSVSIIMMWAFVMALIFVLNHLYLVMAFFLTYFSFEIRVFLWDYLKPLLHNFVQILLVGSNVKDLTREFEILDKNLKDVQMEIDKDEASMKKPTEEVEGWKKRVQALQPSVQSVVTAYANQSYLRNVYSISKEAVNKLKEVRQEVEFIKSVRAYTTAAPPPMVQEVPTATLAAPGGEIESKLKVALGFLRYWGWRQNELGETESACCGPCGLRDSGRTGYTKNNDSVFKRQNEKRATETVSLSVVSSRHVNQTS